ncbi:uncharacterized protein LOC111380584 [Olea europaea var. sylvestris]|uniref:uncharacterized protein LOC111380584 n=1 Tax=Olea europaea var. sylvestris TaxID=158386 RepID=UPI000C1D4382|nr:uncharacterized protein LOC111380584 [Olea europaea var. sylvestris]
MEDQHSSKRVKTLFSFFKKTGGQSSESISPKIEHPSASTPMQHPPNPAPEIQHSSVSTPELQSCTSIEWDLGKRKQMFEHPANLRDEIRIAYIKVGPYQLKLEEYPRVEGKKQARRFQKKWFTGFPWLEYSSIIEKAYCFYCFLFQKEGNSSACSGLVTEGYNKWKRVKDGNKCAFLVHANSAYHKPCETRAKDLIKPSQHIDKEVGDECFCILVDEAQDASNREQMTIILRFVNSHGSSIECYFAIQRVSDITSLNLKNEICDVLAQYELRVNKMRGQGYDSASNMRGALNGLQALFHRDCPCAYYVHCFAHRLQLTLVAAAKEVHVIWNFFSHLDKIVNVITSSPKRVTELQFSHREKIQCMLDTGERESGSGANQMVNLQ